MARHRPQRSGRRTGGEHGFTLVEVLLSTTIMLVVSGALAMVVVTVLRTQRPTVDRLSGSQSEQLVTKYLPADVQQALAVDGDPTAAPACASYGSYGAGLPGARNIVRFTSRGSSGADHHVAYRTHLSPDGASGSAEWQLLRVACDEGGPAEVIVAAHQLRDADAAVLVLDAARPRDVSLQLHLQQPDGGEAFSFTVGGSRTPTDLTLPGGTATTVSHPTPSAPPCTVTRFELVPAAVVADGGELQGDVSVVAELLGACPLDWKVTYQPGATPVTTPLDGSSGTYTGTIPGGSTAGARTDWPAAPATRDVTLTPVDGSAVAGTNVATLTLQAPATTPTGPVGSACVLVNPNPTFGGNAKLNGNKLEQELRLVMQPTTNPHQCLQLAIRFTTNDNKVQTIAVVSEGQNVTAKIPAGSKPFAKGTTYAVDIIDRAAGDVTIGTSSFTTWN